MLLHFNSAIGADYSMFACISVVCVFSLSFFEAKLSLMTTTVTD